MSCPKLPAEKLARILLEAASSAPLPNAAAARQVLKAIDEFTVFFSTVYAPPEADQPPPAQAPPVA